MLKKLLLEPSRLEYISDLGENVNESTKNGGTQGQHPKKSHCRFCANEMNYQDLIDLTTNGQTMEKFLLILEFFKVDFISFSDQKLPKTTCQPCYNIITKCYNFFLNVQESQVTLNKLYHVKNEPGEFIEIAIKSEISKTFLSTAETVALESQSTANPEQVITYESNDTLYMFETDVKTEELDETSIPPCNTFTCSRDPLSNTSNNQTEEDKNFYKAYRMNNSDTKNLDSASSRKKANPSTPKARRSRRKTENTERKTVNTDRSWNGYPWSCQHCHAYGNLNELRTHSLELHKKCYAFKCADCNEYHKFNMFNNFIEHVRQHRESLRYYCAYCNKYFETIAACSDHTLTHWSNGQRVCEWCGVIFPDAAALKVHKSSSGRLKAQVMRAALVCNIKGSEFNFSWDNYEWSCQECSHRFPDAQSLRTHTQELHDKCFSMKCADCLKASLNFRFFIAHVRRHRPYLGRHCPYCNARIEDADEMKKHEDEHFTGAQRPCDGCGQIFENKQLEAQHYEQFTPRRRTKFLTTEDLTCDICKNVCNTLTALRRHKVTHDEHGRKKYACFVCRRQFLNDSSLKYHIKTHGERDKVCKICNQTFATELRLRGHVVTHLEKDFICDYCSRRFATKRYIINHIMRHHLKTSVKKFKCQVCGKCFHTSTNLQTHSNVHTGARPYQCQNCDKTFTNWANCNKHMFRIHNTTLAKSKMTARGRIPIDSTEEDIKIKYPKEWVQDVLNSKKGSKTSN